MASTSWSLRLIHPYPLRSDVDRGDTRGRPYRFSAAIFSRCDSRRPVHVGVGLAALEEEVQVVLPGEADAAVDLERGARHAAPGLAGVGLGAGGGERGGLGLVVERPRRPQDGRPRPLDLEQHLRAGVRDGLVGADRAAELLALLGVGDRHLHRPLGDADRVGRVHHRRLQPRALDVGAERLALAAAHAEQPPRGVERLDRLDLGAGHARAVPVDQHVGVRGVGGQPVDHEGASPGRAPRRTARPPTSRAAASAPARSPAPRPARRARRCRARRSPASRARRSPPTAVGEPALLLERQPPHLGERVARGQELARRGLDRPLVLGEVEVHARGRPEHALGDDVLEDLGRAALDRVRAGAQEAIRPRPLGELRARAGHVHRQLGHRLVDLGPLPLAERALRARRASSSPSARGRR